MRWTVLILFFGTVWATTSLYGQTTAAQMVATPLDRFEMARSLQSGKSGQPDIPAASAIYRQLLTLKGDPNIRRAELELGNLVLDGKYKSEDPRQNLYWARMIAQELLGQEQFKLAVAQGSAMDLPESPEVNALYVRTAASYNVDNAQRQMALRVSPAEGAAWLRLAGQYFTSLGQEAEAQDRGFTPGQRQAVGDEYADLLATHYAAGAYYRKDDPLLNPGQASLEALLIRGTDPDAQLRLAYYYELRAGDPNLASMAMNLYRLVRDGRESSIRFKIGTRYEQGIEGFPKDPARAAQWFGFAAKAASLEACGRIRNLEATSTITHTQAADALTGCPR